MAAIADRMSSLVSPPLPSPSMSSDHFRVTYVVAAADDSAARAVVDALCLEQTVELPQPARQSSSKGYRSERGNRISCNLYISELLLDHVLIF